MTTDTYFLDLFTTTVEREFEGAGKAHLKYIHAWAINGYVLFPDGLRMNLGTLYSVAQIEHKAPMWRRMLMDFRTGALPMGPLAHVVGSPSGSPSTPEAPPTG